VSVGSVRLLDIKKWIVHLIDAYRLFILKIGVTRPVLFKSLGRPGVYSVVEKKRQDFYMFLLLSVMVPSH
jgi:hypothetical protein